MGLCVGACVWRGQLWATLASLLCRPPTLAFHQNALCSSASLGLSVGRRLCEVGRAERPKGSKWCPRESLWRGPPALASGRGQPKGWRPVKSRVGQLSGEWLYWRCPVVQLASWRGVAKWLKMSRKMVHKFTPFGATLLSKLQSVASNIHLRPVLRTAADWVSLGQLAASTQAPHTQVPPRPLCMGAREWGPRMKGHFLAKRSALHQMANGRPELTHMLLTPDQLSSAATVNWSLD